MEEGDDSVVHKSGTSERTDDLEERRVEYTRDEAQRGVLRGEHGAIQARL